MSDPLWLSLSKMFFAPMLAAGITAYITYQFSSRRFIQERWWDRKADAYAEVIKSLVALTYSLDKWATDEYRQNVEQHYESSPEIQKVVRREYKEAKEQIERTATEGDYIISEQSASALSELIKQLNRDPWPDPNLPEMFTWADWFDYLYSNLKMARDCLESIRDEARSDLKVK